MSNKLKALKASLFSLRVKIPVLMMLMAALNILALGIYNKTYFLRMVALRIEKFSGKALPPGALRDSRIAGYLIEFEAIALTVMILLIGIIVYFSYARPLMKLNQNIRAFKDNVVKRTTRRDEIGELQNSFAELTQKLQEEREIQNRIIASISHDIKTPLTSVLGYSERLVKKELPKERVYKYLEVIRNGAKDIEEIIGGFDSYIEGKLHTELKKKNVRLEYIKQMLLEDYEEELALRGIAFELAISCTSEDEISIDLSKLRRVFANLIGNAVRHNANKQGLKISITIAKISGRYHFELSDNGKGVSEQELPHVFEPFYTSDSSRSVSGLGLSICKNIIEAHGGEISAGNNEKTGFSVAFRL